MQVLSWPRSSHKRICLLVTRSLCLSFITRRCLDSLPLGGVTYLCVRTEGKNHQCQCPEGNVDLVHVHTCYTISSICLTSYSLQTFLHILLRNYQRYQKGC